MILRVIEPALQVVPPKLPLMWRPSTPRPVIPVFVEPLSSGDKYVPVSLTTESDVSPQEGGIPVSSPSIVDKGAWVADYLAGNPYGPHHQPALFDTEQAPAWVVPPPPSVPIRNSVPQATTQTKCFHCRLWGHYSMKCHTPHDRCAKSRRCITPHTHPNFGRVCQASNQSRRCSGSPQSRSPGFLLTYDLDVGQPLTEDYIDYGTQRPDELPQNSLIFCSDTPVTTRSPTYWNSIELQTAPATVLTLPDESAWPLVLPWESLNNPSIPPEWEGRGGLVNGGLEVSIYNGGNVTPFGGQNQGEA